MGNCVKKTKETTILSHTFRLQAPMQTLAEEREEVLNFRVDIFRWKIRGFPRDTYFLKAWWTALEFETMETEGSDVVWDAHWQFSFQAGLTELKGNNITVMLFSSRKNAAVSKLRIKLWDIATGPSLQNFALEDAKKKVIGRISFKALMRQETTLVLRPSNVSFELKKEHKGKFCLAIKSVTEECETSMQLPATDTSSWNCEDDFLEEGHSLSFPATIETLRNASLQLRLIKLKKTGAEHQAAECWLTFSKMFKQEKYTVVKRDGPGYRSFGSKKESELDLDALTEELKTYSVTRPFHEKLWDYGKEVGAISGLITMMNIPLVSQLITGVNTENGFMAQSSNFVENSAKTPKTNQRATVPQEILKLAGLTEALTAYFASGEKREGALLSSKGSEIREHINKVKEVISLLRESKKHSMISFVYENKTDLIIGQNAFLDIGEHLLGYADVTAYAVRPFYYEALVHVTRRGELDLGSLAITEENERQRSKKIPVGVRYRSFLRSLLISALGKLKIKGVDKRSQQFTEFVCAVSYFRIPEFRQVLLRCLKEKSFEDIPEWRDVPWDSEREDNTVIETHVLPMFDWTNLFYASLPLDSEEDKELAKALIDPTWKKRVAKRGVAYFRLISEWATHVKRLFTEKHIPWLEIPGYSVIVKTFLIEMKIRKLEEYPVVMTQSSVCLLNNPNLLSILLRVLFGKTNVYSVELVSDSFEILNLWFTQLYEDSQTLPLSFEESYFLQGLRIALSSDIGFNIAKAIWFLYRNYQLIPIQTKREIVLSFLLKDSEAREMVLHWSQSVRITYWNLLFFRLISQKFIQFDTFTELDEEIYLKSAEFAGFMHKAKSEDVEESQRPYLVYTKSELQKTRESYEVWLKQVQGDLALSAGRIGIYKGLGAFPYPDMNVENALVDKSENRMQEEW